MKHIKLYEQIDDPFGEEDSSSSSEIPQEVGNCPNCGNQGISYGRLNPYENQQVGWEFDCEDCGFCGVELYSIEFVQNVER